MNERYLQDIKAHLQHPDVQERIRQNMQRGREEATVTIGRAARLFGFTENKLRDWENLGLLKPLRSKDVTGQRQYSPDELNKLAILKELIEEGSFSPGSIPSDIDHIWNIISGEQKEADHRHIEQRVEHAYYQELFWRYYASHVLRLSLMLICEDLPGTVVGLVLPFKEELYAAVPTSENLSEVGESLIGWLGQTTSFYTFLTQAPSFEYPSDYRILRLQAIGEDAPKDNTLMVVDRRVKPPHLSISTVEVIRRLLIPLYEDIQQYQSAFGPGMCDWLDPGANFSSNVNPSDTILTGLANMIVRLGGRSHEGENRWSFCCILLPKDSTLPLQQRSLVLRARSKDAPAQYRVGVTKLSPDEPFTGLSLRAFQGGHIVYRSRISSEDFTIAFREAEGPIGSAIAIPIGGEDGQPIAVLYIASHESDAFSGGDQHKGDQRVLRMMSRIVEELLRTYAARLRAEEKLVSVITNPSLIDISFRKFLSENEFISDVENLLTDIETHLEQVAKQPDKEIVSFIAVDIDNQSSIANRYGDLVTRNLCRELGQRIQGKLRTFFTKFGGCQLYHMYADRYYLFLRGVQLEQEGEEEELLKKAEQLRKALEGPYHVDAQRTSIEEPLLPASMLTLSDITVRLGVTLYTYSKLRDILRRYPIATAVPEVRSVIIRSLDDALKKGMDEGGNVVIAWDSKTEGFVRWPPKN